MSFAATMVPISASTETACLSIFVAFIGLIADHHGLQQVCPLQKSRR